MTNLLHEVRVLKCDLILVPTMHNPCEHKWILKCTELFHKEGLKIVPFEKIHEKLHLEINARTPTLGVQARVCA